MDPSKEPVTAPLEEALKKPLTEPLKELTEPTVTEPLTEPSFFFQLPRLFGCFAALVQSDDLQSIVLGSGSLGSF